MVWYHAKGMVLLIHSDGYYISAPQVRRWAGDFYFYERQQKNWLKQKLMKLYMY